MEGAGGGFRSTNRRELGVVTRSDTEGITTVLHANGAFRMLTKARRELAFGRKGTL